MRKSQVTEEQMITALREADRTEVAEAAKKHKVSEATIYGWRKHFGQMDAADIKPLKTLEQENARLKKLLAEAALDIKVLKEFNSKKVVSPQGWSQQVQLACQRGLSQRRACGLIRVARSTLAY